jgi:hypothetical protein
LQRTYAIYKLFLYCHTPPVVSSLILFIDAPTPYTRLHAHREFQETASEIGKAIINESTLFLTHRITIGRWCAH